jgi:hypothetical protein
MKGSYIQAQRIYYEETTTSVTATAPTGTCFSSNP